MSSTAPCSGRSSSPRRWRRRTTPILLRLERQRRLDEARVGEPLREIAEVLTGRRIHLFREQPEVIRMRDEALEDLAGLALHSQSGQGVDEPEGARQESALGSCLTLARAVAVDERS